MSARKPTPFMGGGNCGLEVIGETSEYLAGMNINFAVSKPRSIYPFLKSL